MLIVLRVCACVWHSECISLLGVALFFLCFFQFLFLFFFRVGRQKRSEFQKAIDSLVAKPAPVNEHTLGAITHVQPKCGAQRRAQEPNELHRWAQSITDVYNYSNGFHLFALKLDAFCEHTSVSKAFNNKY